MKERCSICGKDMIPIMYKFNNIKCLGCGDKIKFMLCDKCRISDKSVKAFVEYGKRKLCDVCRRDRKINQVLN